MSTPRDELLARLLEDGVISADDLPNLQALPQEPLVYWAEHIQTFSIGQVVINHCPWCGASLPPAQEPPAGPRGPVHIIITPDGNPQAFADGQPIDLSILRLEAANAPAPDE